ncbi:MAG: hypothetical protein IJL76_00615 [Bacilli bacterium]|nr:hypothetical protein [Bacilli bacterium]
MEFIKKHKNISSLILIIILGIITLIYAKNLMNSTDREAIYGTRTKATEEVKITNNKEDQLIEVFKDIDEKTTVEERGNIIEIVVTVKDNINTKTLKSKANDIKKILNNKERKVYDVQVFGKKNTKDKSYPIIGYLHRGSDSFSWTKDR